MKFPLLHFLVFDEWAVFDHEKECLWVMVLNRGSAKDKLEKIKDEWQIRIDRNRNGNSFLT